MPRLPWAESDLDALGADSFLARTTQQITDLMAPYLEQAKPSEAPPKPETPRPSFDLSDWSPWRSSDTKTPTAPAPSALSAPAPSQSSALPSFNLADWSPWRDSSKPQESRADTTSSPSGFAGSRPQASSGAPQAMPTTSGLSAPSGGGDIDNSSRESFVRTAYPYALQAADGDATLANQLLATAISENGKVGTGQSLGEMGFNVGGIQGIQGTAGSFTALDAGRPRQFAAYNNLGEGFRAVRDLMSSGRYAQAAANYRQTGDIDRYWREVNEAGYSETPTWQDSIADIRRTQVEPLTAGLGNAAPASRPQTQPQAPSAPSQAQADQGGSWEVDQAALDDPDKWSLCGPVAAVMAAAKRGGQWTVAQAKQIASASGLWDAAQGMGGLGTEVSLLNKMGVSARIGQADQATLAADAQAGNTPIISTNRHYFILKGYDPATGKFDTTTSGSVLKGGSRYLTLDEIERLGGGIQGAAYMDNPASPAPSVAVGSPATQDAYKVADSLPETGLSAGDQKRQKLAALQGEQTMLRQPLMATQGPDTATGEYDPRDADSGAHEAGYTVDGGVQPASGGADVSGGTAQPPRPDSVPASYGSSQDDPGSPPAASPYTVVPATAPLASDQGQTVEVQTTPRPADRYQTVAADQPLQSDQGNMVEMPVTRPGSQAAVYGGGQDDPGTPPIPPRVVQASVPSISLPDLTPVYNAAGQLVSYVQHGVQAAADQIGANMAGNRQAVVDANAAVGYYPPSEPSTYGASGDEVLPQSDTVGASPFSPLFTPIKPTAPQYPEIAPDAPPMPSEMTMAQRERIRQGGQLSQEETDAILARRREHTTLSLADEVRALPYQAAEGARQTVVDAARSLMDAIKAGQEGRPLAAAGNALMTALQVIPPGPQYTAAMHIVDQMFPEARIAGIGPGVLVGGREALGAALQGVNALKAAPGRLLTPENLARADEAITSGVPNAVRGAANVIDRGIEAGRGVLDANAARVAQADARAAEQGSIRAPGTLGVISNNPLEASTVARSRVVPPDVADTLDFPVRVPTDPATVRAIEAAGGSVDPERGVTLHVIRNQGPEAAGGTATRGATFHIAGPPGTPNPYATSGKSQTGGSDRIEGWTRYRSPMILSDAPGSQRGFDEGMTQLGLLTDENNNWRGLPMSNAGPSYDEVNRGIAKARDAGPPGSPERAQAIKDLTSRFGGDPNVIDDLLAVRGADQDESAWSIRENILAHNARKQGYDGVLTVQPSMGGTEYQDALEAAVQAHPDWQAQKAEVDRWAAEMDRLDAEYGRAVDQYGWGKPEPESVMAQAQKATDQYERAQTKLEKIHDRLIDQVDVPIPHKITELADFRESHNPTPGAPNPIIAEFEQRVAAANDAEFQALQQLSADKKAGKPESPDLVEAYRTARSERLAYSQALQRLRQQSDLGPGPTGYTLRSDIPRRGGSTEATATPGIAATTRALGDVSNAIGGGVGGAAIGGGLPADNEDDRRRNALIGAGAGMLLGPAAGRLMRRGEGGALATPGVGPNKRPTGQIENLSESSNPHLRNLARMMAGKYQPVGETRPILEQVASALTDRFAIHANVEKAAAANVRAAGNTPPATRLVDRIRENPASIGTQRVLDEVGPPLRQVGNDDDALAAYAVLRHNRDIAVEKGQEAYAQAISRGRTPQQAQAIADRIQNSRQFSGGVTLAEEDTAIKTLAQELGPERFKQVQAAHQQLVDVFRQNLQRKLDARMISQDRFDTLTRKYPNYVRTDIADYYGGGPSSPSPAGKALGVGDVGIKAISREGTAKDRVNPIISAIDSVFSTEAAIQKNNAARDLFDIRDADPATAAILKEVAPDVKTWRANQKTMVPPDYTLRAGEAKVTRWDSDVARQLVVPKEYNQLVNPDPGGLLGDSPAATVPRTLLQVWKNLVTKLSPSFSLVTSPLRDVNDALVSGATKAATQQGPAGAAQALVALPQILLRDIPVGLARGVQGLGTGNVGERVRELRMAGAGFESRPSPEYRGRLPRWLVRPQDTRAMMEDLKRQGGFPIQSPGDVMKLFGIGDRLEMAPRIAAADAERARGGDALAQAMAYKDATIPYDKGGWLVRQLNVPIPFLNPTVQAAAQVARLARQNPAAYTAAVAASVAIPAMIAEAWNRSDPERANNYADRPDYLKNTGIIWELNGVEGTGKTGEKLPNFIWQPLGSHAYVARAAREALGLADRATGLITPPATPATDQGDWRHWAKVGTDLVSMFSPVKGGSIGQTAGGLVPPGMSEAIESYTNKDLYRGSPIVSTRNDERASQLSQGISRGINTLFPGTESRPSSVEHWLGVGGAASQMAEAASNIGRDRGVEQHPIQDVPVVGGLANRIVRDTGGQTLNNERDAMLTPGAQRLLNANGLRSDQILPADATGPNGYPFTQQQEAEVQRIMNQRMADLETMPSRIPNWDRLPVSNRQALIRDFVTKARGYGEAVVFSQIPPDEKRRVNELVRQQAQKRAS